MPAIPALRDYLKTRRSVGIGFLKDPGPTPEELEEILHRPVLVTGDPLLHPEKWDLA